jgi:hypothetical protein
MSSPSSSSNEAKEGRVIGPEDFVTDEAEEACALAQTTEASAAEQATEEADR